jgi:hypothetical protein
VDAIVIYVKSQTLERKHPWFTSRLLLKVLVR